MRDRRIEQHLGLHYRGGLLPDLLGRISQSWERATSTTGGFLTAVLIGWFVELLYGLSTQPTVGLTPVSWRDESLGSSSLALRHVVLRFRGIL